MPELIEQGFIQPRQWPITGRLAIPEPGHRIGDTESLQAPLLDNFKPAALGQIRQRLHVKIPTVYGAVEKLLVRITQKFH